jgi:uncharacterized membrane protein
MEIRFFLAAAILLSTVFILQPTPARANLKLCNNTVSRVGVALGYKDTKGWASEGWWNLEANTCETLLEGPLIARYYYIYAVDYDLGGSWGGKAYMCTRDKVFTIRANKGCTERGFQKTGYFEVDTGEEKDWTVSLSGPQNNEGNAK